MGGADVREQPLRFMAIPRLQGGGGKTFVMPSRGKEWMQVDGIARGRRKVTVSMGPAWRVKYIDDTVARFPASLHMLHEQAFSPRLNGNRYAAVRVN